jgi:hypothetical protein
MRSSRPLEKKRHQRDGLKSVESSRVERQEVAALAYARTTERGITIRPRTRGDSGAPYRRENQSPALSRRRSEEEAHHEDEEADHDSESREKKDASDRLVERARGAEAIVARKI